MCRRACQMRLRTFIPQETSFATYYEVVIAWSCIMPRTLIELMQLDIAERESIGWIQVGHLSSQSQALFWLNCGDNHLCNEAWQLNWESANRYCVLVMDGDRDIKSPTRAQTEVSRRRQSADGAYLPQGRCLRTRRSQACSVNMQISSSRVPPAKTFSPSMSAKPVKA